MRHLTHMRRFYSEYTSPIPFFEISQMSVYLLGNWIQLNWSIGVGLIGLELFRNELIDKNIKIEWINLPGYCIFG
jgi:hypothetical protein